MITTNKTKGTGTHGCAGTGRDLAEICRHYGIKATHQRTEILRELLSSKEHPDAETLYKRVKPNIPSISLDTVYRNLRLLAERGIIRRLGTFGDSARFDGNREPHHHFTCTRCGLICDFSDDLLARYEPEQRVEEIAEVRSMHIEVRGLCGKCARLENTRSRGTR